jgi:hypothetical protein
LLFERLYRSLIRLRTDVAVAFEHLTAYMSRESLNRLLADVGIFREPRDERVAHIVRRVAHTSGFAGERPRLAPRTHRTAEVNVPQNRNAGVSTASTEEVIAQEWLRPIPSPALQN